VFGRRPGEQPEQVGYPVTAWFRRADQQAGVHQRFEQVLGTVPGQAQLVGQPVNPGVAALGRRYRTPGPGRQSVQRGEGAAEPFSEARFPVVELRQAAGLVAHPGDRMAEGPTGTERDAHRSHPERQGQVVTEFGEGARLVVLGDDSLRADNRTDQHQ
jgi:hypothetical protein